MTGLRQREPRYENRSLLDLAHLIHECTNCGSFVHNGCEPAHGNGIAAGKGQGTKGQDNRHAALCPLCHTWYDSGRSRSPCGLWSDDRTQKGAMWTRAHLRTYDIYWREGWVLVSDAGRAAHRTRGP